MPTGKMPPPSGVHLFKREKERGRLRTHWRKNWTKRRRQNEVRKILAVSIPFAQSRSQHEFVIYENLRI